MFVREVRESGLKLIEELRRDALMVASWATIDLPATLMTAADRLRRISWEIRFLAALFPQHPAIQLADQLERLAETMHKLALLASRAKQLEHDAYGLLRLLHILSSTPLSRLHAKLLASEIRKLARQLGSLASLLHPTRLASEAQAYALRLEHLAEQIERAAEALAEEATLHKPSAEAKVVKVGSQLTSPKQNRIQAYNLLLLRAAKDITKATTKVITNQYEKHRLNEHIEALA